MKYYDDCKNKQKGARNDYDTSLFDSVLMWGTNLKQLDVCLYINANCLKKMCYRGTMKMSDGVEFHHY